MFLRRYIKFRGVCQETYYNVARVMHQLSKLDLKNKEIIFSYQVKLFII